MKDQTFDEIALRVAEFTASLFQEFPKHENAIANVLADSLGGLIAIAAKEPAAALEHIAERLREYPWTTVRAEHMMAVQGIKDAFGRVRAPNLGVITSKPP